MSREEREARKEGVLMFQRRAGEVWGQKTGTPTPLDGSYGRVWLMYIFPIFTSRLRGGLVKYEMAYSALVIDSGYVSVVSRYFKRKRKAQALHQLSIVTL